MLLRRVLVPVSQGGDEWTHLPGVISTTNTLCAWTDVEVEEVHADEVTCPECCKVVRKCREVPLSVLGDRKKRVDKNVKTR